MHTRSIRFRLTFLYSLVLIVSTAILFAIFFAVTSKELYSHTDSLLRSHVVHISDVVHTTAGSSDRLSNLNLDQVFSETPGMLIIVTDQSGTPIYQSQAFSDTRVIQQLLDSFRRQNNEGVVSILIGRSSMRFVIQPIEANGNIQQLIMVGHPIDVVEQSLRSLITSLIVVFIALIIPTIIGGYIFSGRVLRPIKNITNEIEEISTENLDKRIKNPQTDDELEALSLTFNKLINRIQESFIRERQFIGDVAHEFKTPLATMKTSVEVALSKKRTNDEYRKVLEEVIIDIDRSSQTLTNILDLAWTQTDASQNKFEVVSLTDIATDVSEIGKKLSLAKDITFRENIEDDVTIKAKKDMVFRALLNIIDNAVKYSDKKGTIELRVKKRDNIAHISIKDTGKGINPEDLPHVFDRFYRGSKTEKTFGAGLGLAITQGIIHSFHGEINVISNKGQGTTVQIEIPLIS